MNKILVVITENVTSGWFKLTRKLFFNQKVSSFKQIFWKSCRVDFFKKWIFEFCTCFYIRNNIWTFWHFYTNEFDLSCGLYPATSRCWSDVISMFGRADPTLKQHRVSISYLSRSVAVTRNEVRCHIVVTSLSFFPCQRNQLLELYGQWWSVIPVISRKSHYVVTHFFRCCVIGQGTPPSHALLDSGVNEYLVILQCVR